MPETQTLRCLHRDRRHRVREQHHCARCQPHGNVLVISCSRCDDCPLVTGTDEASVELSQPILTWLEGHGWTTTPELVCGNHNR